MKALWLALALLAGPALAQDVKDAPGARLRLLDKESGNTQDLELSNGQSVTARAADRAAGQLPLLPGQPRG